ncbi:MAG: Smr/MutS family protein [Victivallales bacterium]|nr:Smr/MutS family protein [Victivallales bacterium]MCF7888953.1 Smr/MutS family protein [Victivallales bacterium]
MAKKKQNHNFFYDLVLDLHGYTLEDAILELERAMYSGKYSSIMVVHGLGQGILRRGIREYAASNSFIKKCYYGENLNISGREGVTLIEV